MAKERTRKRSEEEETVVAEEGSEFSPRKTREEEQKERMLESWIPKTDLGKRVKAGGIKTLEEIFASNAKILEPEIVDSLISLEEKMVEVKKTARVVRAGRKFSFRVTVLVGDRNKFVGVGTAKDVEKWPAARKAARVAKLNLVEVRRGSGSWEAATTTDDNSVPFKVEGKGASVRVALLPAPKGIGLVAGNNIKDVLVFAGIRDVWCKTKGNSSTMLNFIRAAIDALSQTTKMKQSDDMTKKSGERK
ncbi:MAG: 30S ribosomal protein S5 [Candidatus Diapherotrites archaeon]|nr:30S ribosomal protein S5 [Candidatus Diapherotrites archaeon]